MYEYINTIPYFFIGAMCLHLFVFIGEFPKKYITSKTLCLAGIITYIAMFNEAHTIFNILKVIFSWFLFAVISGLLYHSNKDSCVLDNAPQIPTLIENAGLNAGKIIKKKFNLKNKNVVIFCGIDTNGCIGMIFARYIRKSGANVSIFIPKRVEDISFYLTKTYYDIIKDSDIKIFTNNFPEMLKTDIVVDAMVGSNLNEHYNKYKKNMKLLGLHIAKPPKKVPKSYKKMVEIFNKQNCTKVSLDYPSGIDPKSGDSSGMVVKPDLTITFNDARKGLNKSNSGEIILIDVGIKK